MANISAWRNTAGSADGFLSIDKAVHTAATIAEKPTTITIVRDGATDHTETVRVEVEESVPDRQMSAEARGGVLDMLITGYKDHPTITDTDIVKADRFRLNDVWYEVVEIYPEITGRFMALAEASSYGF